MDAQKAAQQLQKGEPLEVNLEGEKLLIMPDEVEARVEAHEGFSAVSEGAYVAGLETELTPALELEGLAREFVRRIQDLRKTADLQVDDRIEIEFAASGRLTDAIESFRDYIIGETLAMRLEKVEKPTGQASAEHSFDGEQLEVALRKAGRE